MTPLNESYLRSRGLTEAVNKRSTAQALLREDQNYLASQYDVFLSHSFLDYNLVLGIKRFLEDLGLSVYVDWIDDPQLNRNMINKETANLLRIRMKTCKSMLYAATDNASNSRWMPWELGYFDGLKGKIAILPISNDANSSGFVGQEYINLYPQFEIEQVGNGVRLVGKNFGFITSYPHTVNLWIDSNKPGKISYKYDTSYS